MTLTIHDIQQPILRHFRRHRMAAVADLLHLTPETRVLDVGGHPGIWRYATVRPRITFLNLWPSPPFALAPGDCYVQGDARKLDLPDRSYGVVYSNSVIEHLGTWDAQQAMAREVRRVGEWYYVQTPNRHFPVEPHLLGVGIHWLPQRWQRRLIRRGTAWGWTMRPTDAAIRAFLAEVRLLTRQELDTLFPDATIVTERAAGWPKSFIAVRH